MIQSLNYFNAGDPKMGAAYEGTAEKLLGEDTSTFIGDANEGMDLQVTESKGTWML
jgi:hypothetical protein